LADDLDVPVEAEFDGLGPGSCLALNERGIEVALDGTA
jgi:hypothetical protein